MPDNCFCFFFSLWIIAVFLSQKVLLFFPLMSENERRTFLFENEAPLQFNPDMKLRPHSVKPGSV